MLRKIISYGAIGGLIVAVPMIAIMVATEGRPPLEYGMLVGYATMLIALSTVFVAIKRQRDVDGGGVIRFWPAFGLGLGISAVAGLLYVLAWELALAITQADFIGSYTETLIAEERAKGASPAAIAKLRAEMEAFKTSYANPLFRMPLTFAEIFPVGVLVSLVSAGLLRNPRFLPARRD
ncbi:MAG TPA: DUF4199 domain-containing protein [Allosphingosinicella sp.]|uniref:DUF4199 domain-containing protein n=1 Tax=Allosphingosinicella sp. TaxID=2823234 RepID=UPI002F2A49C7